MKPYQYTLIKYIIVCGTIIACCAIIASKM